MTGINCDERTKGTLYELIKAEKILRWAIRGGQRKIMWEKSQIVSDMQRAQEERYSGFVW